jgi:hypothetical protein
MEIEYLKNAKSLIRKVLSGEVTPETDRAKFQDDAIVFAVHEAQTRDVDWLLNELAAPKHKPEAKRLVVQLMTQSTERTRAEAMLV